MGGALKMFSAKKPWLLVVIKQGVVTCLKILITIIIIKNIIFKETLLNLNKNFYHLGDNFKTD